MDQTDYLPLRMLNQLEYCERRFYLMHVQGEMEVNAAVLDGTQRHERAHAPGASTEQETTTHRRVYVWSDRLRIAGYADVVEERQGEGETRGRGEKRTIELCPVEYKRGKMGRWLNDHVQLCAQAMCLEERTGTTIQQGYIFYFGSRHREPVEFTAELRARTETAVQRAFAIAASGVMPLPTDRRQKCHDCSLEPVCLPQEVDVLTGLSSWRWTHEPACCKLLDLVALARMATAIPGSRVMGASGRVDFCSGARRRPGAVAMQSRAASMRGHV
jgi:CRISPR-associated exonuclease Cas4